MPALARYCRFVLVYDLAVIVWGAYVRASGSGAGCGSHWPLCNGEVVPWRRSAGTWIEYSHRLSSGLVLVLAVVLVAWAWRAAPRGHLARRGAVLALLFTLAEAAVGAGLVLFKLVAHDESLARALVITAHLLNTLLLLAALTLAAYGAGAFGALSGAAAVGVQHRLEPAALGAEVRGRRRRGRQRPTWLGGFLMLGLAATMAIAATGAVAALGDTLFPSASLRQGLAQDLSPASHLLLRLRTVHPLLAIALGVYLIFLCERAAAAAPAARRWAHGVRLLVFVQWTVGLMNIGLLAPVWLQLCHLLIADLLWIALVMLALEAHPRRLAAVRAAPLLQAAART